MVLSKFLTFCALLVVSCLSACFSTLPDVGIALHGAHLQLVTC
jgi:hypothetical protein